METQRDKIWTTALQLIENRRGFTIVDVLDAIEGDAPSQRTVRETLAVMDANGFIQSEGGSGSAPRTYFTQQDEPDRDVGGYNPRPSTHSGTFPYPGSKSHLADWIIDTMPAHDTYVEVFGGSAGVLFEKERSKYEVYNDINNDLVQFFTVLRNRTDELAEWLSHVPYSRELYKQWVEEFYRGIRPDDSVKRAGRFFALRYMQYISVSDAPNGFRARAKRSPARTFSNATERIEKMAERFEDVTIENQHYRDILTNYDASSVDVLFYIDPPYLGSEDRYEAEFDRDGLLDSLHDIDGDWMLSCEFVPSELEEYIVLEKQGRLAMRRESGEIDEGLVCNFDPAKRLSFLETIDD